MTRHIGTAWRRMKWCWRRFTAKLSGQQDSRKGQILIALSFVLSLLVFLLSTEAQSLSRTFARITDPDGVTYSQSVTGGGGAFLDNSISPLGEDWAAGSAAKLGSFGVSATIMTSGFLQAGAGAFL